MIVVGGGQVVEAVRDLDRCHDLDANLCHWTCVDLLESTAELAAKILGGLPVIDSLDQLREAETLSPVIVRVSAFYRRDSRANWGLPETWETTTDSLAACLAQAVGASELVLLKSCGESESLVAAGAGYGAEHRHVKLNAWSDAGWVDDAFSLCARDIPQIRMVDLRNASV